MAAFERISSGIPMMDQALDNIRLGDNAICLVSELDQFRSWPGSLRPRRRMAGGTLSTSASRSTRPSWSPWRG